MAGEECITYAVWYMLHKPLEVLSDNLTLREEQVVALTLHARPSPVRLRTQRLFRGESVSDEQWFTLLRPRDVRYRHSPRLWMTALYSAIIARSVALRFVPRHGPRESACKVLRIRFARGWLRGLGPEHIVLLLYHRGARRALFKFMTSPLYGNKVARGVALRRRRARFGQRRKVP